MNNRQNIELAMSQIENFLEKGKFVSEQQQRHLTPGQLLPDFVNFLNSFFCVNFLREN